MHITGDKGDVQLTKYEREYDRWLTTVPEDDRQVVGFCDNCLDDYLEGTEVWTDGEITLCSFTCMTDYVAENDEDIDEFDVTIAEK